MFEWFLKEQPLTVRLSRKGLTPEMFQKRMEAQGVEAVQNPLISEAFSLKGFDYLGALPEFREGLCTVQDVSSMLVAKAAGVKPADKVIDVCAAPGGKSIQISELLEEGGKIISRDLTDSAQVQSMVDSVLETYGRIDILVNNAGGYPSEIYDTVTVSYTHLTLPTKLEV